MIYIATTLGILIVVLYSCVATTTAYDQIISDKEQETFLKLYNK